MVDSIAVRIPATVPSSFVVATSAPPAEPVVVAARHLHPLLAPPLRAAARELLSGPLLRAAVCPARVSPWRAALVAAARAPALRERLRTATHHVVVTAHSPPQSHPAHAQAARAIARALAFATAGVVYDAQTACLIGPAARGDVEPPAFRLADDWLSTAISSGGPPGRGARELEVTTRGLVRFGLPELSAAAVRAEHLLIAVSLLRGTAVHLLAGHWAWLAAGGGRSRRLAARPRVGAGDLYQYWGRRGLERWRGAHPPGSGAASVELRLAPAPGDPACLSVRPPEGEGPAAMAAWLSGPVDAIRPRMSAAGPASAVSRSRSGTAGRRSPREGGSLRSGP